MAKILIIDDIATNREFLVTLLGYYQHQLFEAEDGSTGLDMVLAERPELIIADVLMPTMDGYEFVRQLRLSEQVSHTPVIFYTAHYLEKEARELAASCAVGHVIAKPSDPQEVLRTVELALGVNARATQLEMPEQFDREHLRLLTDKLAEKADKLRVINLRLDALIQLGQQLATEQDPRRLVERYCSGVRDIIGAAFTAACLSNSNDSEPAGQTFLCGIDAISGERISSFWRDHDIIKEVVTTQTVRRLVNPNGDPTLLGVSAEHPPVFSFLAVPVCSGVHTHGWLGLWNKLGGDGFTEEDAELALTVCAQLAVRYENVRLYEELRAANVTLEAQVARRTRELAGSNTELYRSNAELEQFAYLASHDLQEPLRMVAIYSQKVLRRYRNQLDSDGEQCLDYIDAGARRMRQLIDDLLNYSKLVVDNSPRAVKFVDLNEIVELARSNCEAGLQESSATVLCEPLAKIQGYPDQLLQLLQNLIGNAVRYRRAEIPPVIRISGKSVESEYVVAVEDNGIGLAMESSESIFRLFTRLHGHEVPGTGVGLAICKRAVENHGGRIWVDSVLGRGSTFHFSLPNAHP